MRAYYENDVAFVPNIVARAYGKSHNDRICLLNADETCRTSNAVQVALYMPNEDTQFSLADSILLIKYTIHIFIFHAHLSCVKRLVASFS